MMDELPQWVRQALRCPVTGAALTLAEGPAGPELVAGGEASPRLAYPVRDGIPILLAHEARQVPADEHTPAEHIPAEHTPVEQSPAHPRRANMRA